LGVFFYGVILPSRFFVPSTSRNGQLVPKVDPFLACSTRIAMMKHARQRITFRSSPFSPSSSSFFFVSTRGRPWPVGDVFSFFRFSESTRDRGFPPSLHRLTRGPHDLVLPFLIRRENYISSRMVRAGPLSSPPFFKPFGATSMPLSSLTRATFPCSDDAPILLRSLFPLVIFFSHWKNQVALKFVRSLFPLVFLPLPNRRDVNAFYNSASLFSLSVSRLQGPIEFKALFGSFHVRRSAPSTTSCDGIVPPSSRISAPFLHHGRPPFLAFLACSLFFGHSAFTPQTICSNPPRAVLDLGSADEGICFFEPVQSRNSRWLMTTPQGSQINRRLR